MLVIYDFENFQAEWPSCALTLGVFDGLHRGHQAIIKRLQKKRHRKDNAPRVLLTYHPHPDFVLGKRKASSGSELFCYEEKVSLFRQLDIDAICFLKFSPDIARITAIRYLKDFILEKLRAKYIVIGYDQSFGRGRKGNYTFLKKMTHRYNFQVEQVHAIKQNQEIISSSQIRKYILDGHIEKANKMLGYDFFITTVVLHGQERGRQLGFRTANLQIPPTKIIPKNGVYVGLAQYKEKTYRAMINVGSNPTFDPQEKEINLEAHLLGFDGNLYDQSLQLSFSHRLREQIKFSSAQELSKQLQKDRDYTSRYTFKKNTYKLS